MDTLNPHPLTTAPGAIPVSVTSSLGSSSIPPDTTATTPSPSSTSSLSYRGSVLRDENDNVMYDLPGGWMRQVQLVRGAYWEVPFTGRNTTLPGGKGRRGGQEEGREGGDRRKEEGDATHYCGV